MWPEQSQLMLMMQASWLAKWRQSLRQFVLQGLGGRCGQNNAQFRLIKWRQSLRQFVLQASEACGAAWPEQYPADAHDARLLARQMGQFVLQASEA